MSDDYHNDNKVNLANALEGIDSISEMEKFLTDLCARTELKAMKERWKVC